MNMVIPPPVQFVWVEWVHRFIIDHRLFLLMRTLKFTHKTSESKSCLKGHGDVLIVIFVIFKSCFMCLCCNWKRHGLINHQKMIPCDCVSVSACLGWAGRVALVSRSAGGGHAGLGEARGGADPRWETCGGPAAPLAAGQTGGAEDHPHQQGERDFSSPQSSSSPLKLPSFNAACPTVLLGISESRSQAFMLLQLFMLCNLSTSIAAVFTPLVWFSVCV